MKDVTFASTIDWQSIALSLDEKGYALAGPVLSVADCQRMQAFYDDPATEFRSTINMARYNFGRGQYKYFDYPLPAVVQPDAQRPADGHGRTRTDRW